MKSHLTSRILMAVLTLSLALPAARETSLSVRDRDLLHRSLTECWGFYKELTSSDDHWLSVPSA